MYGCVRVLRPFGAVARSASYQAYSRRTIQTNAHRNAAVAEARVDNYAPPADYAAPGGVDKVAVSKDGSQLSASVSNESLQLDSLFIRDACNCSWCVDSSTRQKRFQTSDIPLDIKIAGLYQERNGSLNIKWRNDHPECPPDHSTTLSSGHLASLAAKLATNTKTAVETWDAASITPRVHWAEYNDFLHDPATFGATLKELQRSGLVFIRGVPESPQSIEHIGEKIGPLRHTFYGRTWDVQDKPRADNVAYTSHFLGMHMDLLYMKQPPGIQFLHCLKSSCEGGESMFADSFHAAEKLYHEDVDAFNALATFPVAYHYDHPHAQYSDIKPTLALQNPAELHSSSLKTMPELAHINYSPPFQAPFPFPSSSTSSAFRTYHSAIARFAKTVDGDAAQYKYRLNPGECVVFNNRRVLHGRAAFKSGQGERWLKGAYLDTDDFQSRLRVVLAQEAGAQKHA